MSMQNAKLINQKEYLKKYLSGDKEKKKKKKDKKHKKSTQVKIIDDDAYDSNKEEVDEELLLGGEDAPQIVGEYIEENPDAFRAKWRSIAVKEEPKTEPDDETHVRIKQEPLEESEMWGRTGQARKTKEETASIRIKQEKRSISRDKSPTRIKQEILDDTPPRNHDSDQSPARRCNSDQSPPKSRRKASCTPPRNRRDFDESPHRRRQSPTRKRRSTDQSPPRRMRESNQTPPRKRRDSDQSPPRRQRDVASPSNSRRRRDSDQSPPRKRRDSVQSPPRRQRDVKQSSPRRRRDLDQSPSRRRRSRSKGRDQSPARRFNNEERRTQMPPHERKSRWAKAEYSRSPSPPPTHKPKAQMRTLDGKKAGLQDAQSLKTETDERRRNEHRLFEKMSSEVSGRNAEVQIRSTGRRGRRAREAADEDPAEQKRKEEHEQKKKELYDRWGKGLKQLEQRQARQDEMAHEAAKPVARYANDEDLDRHLREQEHADDPMLNYIRQKRKNRELQSDKPVMPLYEGSYPENRFGIRPGYRWDGVDRSNGYEQRWFDKQNERRAIQDEAYKYSVEDM
ncbi:CG13625 [Drosophila busckii]|uniref:BUD13 homolog n=1 Tax=Drosophila busckii TaxID=30019 RepID=A0A0M4EQ62_DROBS|nr:BUD13 homolog [Drosophila busckii]ALC47076.1 CG13625 [Drosophila busckii]